MDGKGQSSSKNRETWGDFLEEASQGCDLGNKKERFPGCPGPRGLWPWLASLFLSSFSHGGSDLPKRPLARTAQETLLFEMKGPGLVPPPKP